MTSDPRRVQLHRHTDATPVWQTILDMYADVRALLLHLPNYRLEAFAERLERHAGEPGFEIVIGHDQGDPVGYAYANTIAPGDRWWQRMDTPLPEEITADPTMVIKELGVRPAWRGTGTARLIHDELLTHRPETRAGLTVNPAAGDGKVLRLYESWGYKAVSTQRPSPESPPLTAMLRNRNTGH